MAQVIGVVDAHRGGDSDAGARQELVRFELVEAVSERVKRAAGEGEAEALEEPRGVHFQAAVTAERLAEIEHHVRAMIADGREHLARVEHRTMRDADAGCRGDGLEQVLGDGGYAVGAGLPRRAASVPLPAPP